MYLFVSVANDGILTGEKKQADSGALMLLLFRVV